MDVTRLRAEPGGQAQLSVKVKNPGHLVESFHMDVVGLDPSWWQVHPPELNIYPGKEESAVVLLKPPANAQAPDEALPFGVRAVSTLDAQRTVVEEGDLEIGRVLDLQASITPVTSRGRWTGRHTITYQNWGNSPTHLRLSVSDKDESLGFRLEPEQVSVPVGSSATARLRVRPRNPFLRGAAVHRTFQVVGESMGAAPPPGTPRSVTARAGVPDPGRPVLDGGIQHLPILSKGVVVLAGLLVAAIAGLVVRGDEDERRRRCPDAGRGSPAADPTGRRGGVGGAHPAALGAQRPRRALPRPAGRRGDQRRAGQRRREGRRDGVRGEGRPAADARVLPGDRRARAARVGPEREAVLDVGRRPVAAPHERAGHRGSGRVQRRVDRQRPERAHGARRRRAGRGTEPGGGQERDRARARGAALHHGGREAWGDAVVAAERPSGVRAADGPAHLRGADSVGRSRSRSRWRGRRRDGGAGRGRRGRWSGGRWSRRGRCRGRGRGDRQPDGAGCGRRARPVRGRGRAALPGAGPGRHRVEADPDHGPDGPARARGAAPAAAVRQRARDRRAGLHHPAAGPAVLRDAPPGLPARLSGGRRPRRRSPARVSAARR